MKRLTLLCLGFCLLPALAGAQQTKGPDAWEQWRFLIGHWQAAASGEPGQGKGVFSFALELHGKILVRRSLTEFPATSDHAAISHDDLLVVYPESGGAGHRAIYFDSEGHVIQYHASFDTTGKLLNFSSDPASGSPSFRLTYSRGENDTLKVKFEIAAPGKPEVFVTHVEGVAHRTGEAGN